MGTEAQSLIKMSESDNLEKDQINLLKVVLRKVEEAEQAAEDYDKKSSSSIAFRFSQ
jgi:hypothetical protein